MAYSLPAELFSELGIGMIIFSLRFYAKWKYVGFRGFGLDDALAGIAVVSNHETIHGGTRPHTNLGGSGILDSRSHVSLHLWYVTTGKFWLARALSTAFHVLMPPPGYFGNNIGLNEESAMAIPDEDLPRLIKGSKHAFVAWVCYIVLVWNLKGVLLLLYSRLTFVTPSRWVYAPFALLTFLCSMGLWQQKLARAMMVFSVATFLASLFWHIFSCFPIYKAWQVKPYSGGKDHPPLLGTVV